MSEQLHTPLHPEHKAELHHSKEHRQHLENLEASGKAQERVLRDSTEQIRQSVATEALSAAEYSPAETETSASSQHPMHASRELRSMTYKRSLTRLQKRESLTDRTLSKIVHSAPVYASSEALSKTIARPSGLIGGGICALLGTSIFLAIARHYGYRYNFLIFVACYAAGLLVGLLIEAAFRLRRRN